MSNPFEDDPTSNPFADPAIQEADDFEYQKDESAPLRSHPVGTPQPPAPVPQSNPRAEELERQLKEKEKELQRREQQLEYKERKIEEIKETYGDAPKPPNFPPFYPLVYHNIREEIPEGGRALVKRVFFSWLLCCWTYFFNVVALLAALIADTNRGGDFAIGLVIFVIGIPVAFVFWYRPFYSAVRKDKSISYVFFFFNYSCHVGISIFFTIGIPSTGGGGYILAFSFFGGETGNTAVAIILLISAGFWTLHSLFCLWQLQGAFRFYRQGGHTLAQARNEAISGAAQSEAGQTFAKEAGKAAVSAAADSAKSRI